MKNAIVFLYKKQLIEECAYYKYLARGCKPGHEIEDWLGAEKEINLTISFSQSAQKRETFLAN